MNYLQTHPPSVSYCVGLGVTTPCQEPCLSPAEPFPLWGSQTPPLSRLWVCGLGLASRCPGLDVAHKAAASSLCKSGARQSSRSRYAATGGLARRARFRPGTGLSADRIPSGRVLRGRLLAKHSVPLQLFLKAPLHLSFPLV